MLSNSRVFRLIALILIQSDIWSPGVVSETFIIGYLTGSQRKAGDDVYPRLGQTISGAISLAVEEINTKRPLAGNSTLKFVVAETFGDESQSIRQTARLWTEGKVSAYIGPQETCIHEARMAASFNLPMISYFCAHPETSNKRLFPTFARTRPPDTQISKSVVSVLLKFNWRKVALLYSKSEAATRDFEAVAKTIQTALTANNIDVKFVDKWTTTYYYGYTENPFSDLVEQSYTKARIYVVVGHYFEHLGILLSLAEKGLLKNGEYFVVGVDVEQYDKDYPRRYFGGILPSEGAEEIVAEQAFQSYIGIVSSPPTGPAYDNFSREVNRYMQLPPFQFENPVNDYGGLKRIPAEAAYLYDAVYVYATALNMSILEGREPLDGKSIFSYMKNRPYPSAMGYMVYMDENGDAEGNYTLIARKKRRIADGEPGKPGSASAFGLYPIGVFELAGNNSSHNIPTLNLREKVDWVSSRAPFDEPFCGFEGEKCTDPPLRWILALAGTFLLVLAIVGMAVYRSWVYEQELDSLLWKVDLKDIIISDMPVTGKSSKLRYSSQVSLSSASDLMEFRYYNVYTQIGIYKGRLVALKRLRKKNVEITRKVKKELKMMRDLRHDNLNQLIGASIDSPNICILTDYCARGSLRDVLQNEDVHLDNIFIASLVGDIIRGMIYLEESPVHSHGNLKSSNCLVDSRWTVKISDFGLHELKAGAEEHSTDIETRCEKLLWRAPELLRDATRPGMGTQKGDVYSFGIILYEILGRRGPWGASNLAPSEIVKRVITRTYGIEPFRPSLDVIYNGSAMNCRNRATERLTENCLQCMLSCWAENPDDRPDFKNIRARLRPIRKGLKNSILDNMLDLMERYTNNLEALVDERTDQLVEEKKKTEALLYDMLPKPVADQLRRGYKVEAESFDSVTVFFSDIVGFTKMSAASTPLEIVDLLNDLYTLFDSIIESYDVYKVETIGDSYMVASGLPIRNGDQHGAEIASMALHLLDSVTKFRIKHIPEERLLMRIGVHSGPVCAGVVGVKMPRYCLFGDTVNTASRMETTSLPLKIHCSEGFKRVLDKLGGYDLVERGMIPIKGKGEMKTYWLIREASRENSLAAACCRNNGTHSPSEYISFHNNILKDLFPLNNQQPANATKHSNKNSFTPELRPRNALTFGSDYLRRKQDNLQGGHHSPQVMKRSSSQERDGSVYVTLLNKKSSSTSTTTNNSRLNLNDNTNLWVESLFNRTMKQALSQSSLSPKSLNDSPQSNYLSYEAIFREKVLSNTSSRSPAHLSLNILSPSDCKKAHLLNRKTKTSESININDESINKRVSSLKDVLFQRMASLQPSQSHRKISRSESVPFLVKDGQEQTSNETKDIPLAYRV